MSDIVSEDGVSEQLSRCGRCGEEILARATAQVMTRDEETGLWHPLSGGGYSTVELSRRTQTTLTSDDADDPTETPLTPSYRVLGRKIADNEMVLNCEVTKDLRYSQATPTFHHWQTSDDRYGATFQSAYEAEVFQKVVRHTVDAIGRESMHKEELTVDVKEEQFIEVPAVKVAKPVRGKFVDVSQCLQPASLPLCEPEAVEEHVSVAGASQERGYLSMSSVKEVLPAVPPRQPLPQRNQPPSIPPRCMLNHSVPIAPRPRHSQSFSVAPLASQRLRQKVPVSYRSLSPTTSDSPPLPPRQAPATAVAPSHSFTLHESRSRSLVSYQRTAVPPSTVSVPCPSSYVAGVPAEPATSPVTNYVYFTEGTTPPPPVAVKGGKPKPDDMRSRDIIGRRLADSSFSSPALRGADDTSLGGAYVRLAMPASTDTPVAHEYCYPNIDVIVPAPTASASSSQPPPPPLPTKSRLSWHDCRRKRKRANRQGIVSTTRERSSYGASESVVSASHLTLDGSSSDSWQPSFLCLLLPCVRPQRNHHHHISTGSGSTTQDVMMT